MCLKITPNQPLKIEIENKKEKNKKDKINNKNNTNIEKETFKLFYNKNSKVIAELNKAWEIFRGN